MEENNLNLNVSYYCFENRSSFRLYYDGRPTCFNSSTVNNSRQRTSHSRTRPDLLRTSWDFSRTSLDFCRTSHSRTPQGLLRTSWNVSLSSTLPPNGSTSPSPFLLLSVLSELKETLYCIYILRDTLWHEFHIYNKLLLRFPLIHFI